MKKKRKTAGKELLPHLFRQEYAKMTAVLCRHFGLHQIEIAEDIASETFLKASEHWAIKGIPDQPVAWLYAVAKNKTRDYFKHQNVFENKIREELPAGEKQVENLPVFDDNLIADSQLAMIFVVCNPAISAEAQICLALQILCGFSVEEIAGAFLANTETIKKRLQRARATLRNDNFQISTLSEAGVKSRLDRVLRTLYLLFNEGYFSKTNNQLIRKELCREALRLGLVLSENPLTNSSEINALLALMCFQSSRLEARINGKGEVVLFEEQNKAQWDRELINKGNYYLIEACSGDTVSKYHLEAGIAYWHTTTGSENKWKHILQLYDQLILIEYSPVTALNRTFAFSKVYGPEKSIPEAEKLHLENSSDYYALLGYLYTPVNTDKAIRHYQKAITLTRSATEKETLARKIVQLRSHIKFLPL